MGNLFRGMAHVQQMSREYLEAESESVAKQNQGVLCTVNLLYTAILVFYNIIVPVKFAGWGLNRVYQTVLVIQIFVLIYNFLRHHNKPRSFKEVQISCYVFQLYVMTFVVTISVLPGWMEQSAIYFAPIMIAFIPGFVFTWAHAVLASYIEVTALIVVSRLLKSEDIFTINLFAAILAFFIAIYISYLVYEFRNNTFEQGERIKELARQDVLTGIYNRGAVEEKILKYIRMYGRDHLTLCIVDVDNFKNVNDTLGHPVGDHVLKSVAHILRDVGGERAFVGRIGGDEFMMFFKRDVGHDEVEASLLRVKEGMHAIDTGSDEIRITTSIGAYEKPEGAEVLYETMFQLADEALYHVKKKGKDSYGFYSK